MSRLHRLLPAVAALLPILACSQPNADGGDWIVRLRATHLSATNDDGSGLGLSINDRTLPELDITRFFGRQIAAELVLTSPQRQTLSAGGTAIGTLRHLPPVLTLQYHFTGSGVARPYVGAGVNWTHFSDVRFSPAAQASLAPSIGRDSFGAALQGGVDVPLGRGWLANVDVKWVQISTEVRSAGVKLGTYRIDPWLVSLGAGYRF
ncbi:MAG TPA: OmpW family outer membrane protein [Burkholderiaceae bacterium]